MIEARDLRRSFEDETVQALCGVTFSIRRGEFVSITGPSGCGKSTLLSILGALDDEFTGDLTVDGVDPRRLKCPETFRSSVIGFVFQSFHLLPTLTALENVQIPMYETSWPLADRRRRAAELLEAVGLSARASHVPGKLSGGERQRVAIARSLANKPKLLLADEPTGNLDSRSAEKILELLRELHRTTDVTLVVVTHDAQVAAMAGRTLRMLDGQLVNETPAPANT
jgi:ABC-type lipoprotein export system ATPase subunit